MKIKSVVAFLHERFHLCDTVISHSLRVSRLAEEFAKREGLEALQSESVDSPQNIEALSGRALDPKPSQIEMAGLLHELRESLHGDAFHDVSIFLTSQGYTELELATMLSWVHDSGDKDSAMQSLGASILWDANLVDDLGATGLANRFLVSYVSNIPFADILDDIQTYEDYVADNVITQTGKTYVAGRSDFVREYIKRFQLEIRGDA